MIISDLCCADSDTNKVLQSLRVLRLCLLSFPLPPARLVFPNLFSTHFSVFSDFCFLACEDLGAYIALLLFLSPVPLCFVAHALVVPFY